MKKAASAEAAREPHLRVAQIWRGEVMGERIFARGENVSIGGIAGCDFTIPALAELPKKHLLLRPSKKGYLLTLSGRMGGKLSLGGATRPVSEFIAQGGEDVGRADGVAGTFRAVPVQDGDWGILHLDGDDDEHTFFFSFTPPEAQLPRTPAVDPEDLGRSAFLFALVVHGILLALTWVFLDLDPRRFSLEAGREALTGYLVRRPDQPVPPPPPEKKPMAGVADGEKNAPPASSEGEAGKSGGEGEKPRARTPEPGPPAPSSRDAIRRAVANKGILREKAKLAAVAGIGTDDDRLGNAVSRLRGDNLMGSAGYGNGSGTGVGPGTGTGTLTRGTGNGPGGGGTAHADVLTQGAIKTGGTRPPRGTPGGTGVAEVAVKLDTGTPDGDFGGLTREQVLKVVSAKRSGFAYCFEKELQRSPKLGGGLVVNWRIDPQGGVAMARVKSSTIGNGAVEDCFLRTVKGLRFPAAVNGQPTIVNFPFQFVPR